MNSEPGIFLACDTLPENPWARDRLPAIRSALAGRTHRIVDIYDFGSQEEAHRLHRTKARGFFTDSRVRDLNRVFRDRVLESNCEIVVLGTVDNYAHFLLPETIRELQAAGCFTVGILGDDEFTYERNWPYAFLFDRVVAYVKSMVDRYNALRPGCCLYLPNSCHFAERDFEALQVSEEAKRHDVALFGSVFPARLRLVERLADAGVPLSLFGGRGWLESSRLKPFYRGYVASADFDRTVRESRLVLALLEDHLTGAAHMNTKIWEAVRNGQMCVSSRHASLVDDYGLVEGEEIVCYDSADDLAAKVLYYLDHPQERRAIAERLFRKISTQFNYRDLYGEFFSGLIRAAGQPAMEIPAAAPAAVTLLGSPGTLAEDAGFPVWRFQRGFGWRRRAAALFDSRVNTSHVILTRGAFRYDACLHAWLGKGPAESNDGVWRLNTAGANTPGFDTLLWEKARFESDVLNGSWWQRVRAMGARTAFPATRPATRRAPESSIARWCQSIWGGVTRGYRAIWERVAFWRLANVSHEVVE